MGKWILSAALALAGAGSAAPAKWHVSEPIVYENLAIFPVLASAGADVTGFVTLDEALRTGDAVVTETGGEAFFRSRDGQRPERPYGAGARVNQLVLIYRGKKPLLLLAGEAVTGGKQDRIIGKDRIVPPGAPPLPLDVFCVEHGRWISTSDHFAAADLIVHPSVRAKAMVAQNQSEVWAAVRGEGRQPGSPARTTVNPFVLGQVISAEAPSESYVKLYRSARLAGEVESFTDEFARRFARATAGLKEPIVGVVVAYGGEVAWADAFASPSLFRKYWGKLLRSYAVEALARSSTHEHPTVEDAGRFLQPLVGHETVESEPGAYRLHEITEGRHTELQLESAAPGARLVHWCKVFRY
jgi:hypothetical protein